MIENVKEIKFKVLTKENFKLFGSIIEGLGKTPTISNEELDYWGSIRKLDIRNPCVSFLTVKRRDFEIDKLERHVNITEVFIPLEGVSIFPMAPPGEIIPLENVNAFLLDGSKGIVMEKGVWHYPPFPITEKATFAVILDERTIDEDLEIRDIRPPIKIRL